MTEKLSDKHFSSELNLNFSRFSDLKFGESHGVELHVGWGKPSEFGTGTSGLPTVELMSAPEVCAVPDPVLSAPEPASMLLLGTGLLGVGAAARRARQKRN